MIDHDCLPNTQEDFELDTFLIPYSWIIQDSDVEYKIISIKSLDAILFPQHQETAYLWCF